MVIRGPSASQAKRRYRRYLAIVGLCALFQVAAADEKRDDEAQDTMPESDATEKSMPEIRIKRLRPADPESTEVMLAGRGLELSRRYLS